jgi:hypothetical protein
MGIIWTNLLVGHREWLLEGIWVGDRRVAEQ